MIAQLIGTGVSLLTGVLASATEDEQTTVTELGYETTGDFGSAGLYNNAIAGLEKTEINTDIFEAGKEKKVLQTISGIAGMVGGMGGALGEFGKRTPEQKLQDKQERQDNKTIRQFNKAFKGN